MKKIQVVFIVLAVLAFGGGILLSRSPVRQRVATGLQAMSEKKTTADRVAEFGGVVRARLAPAFVQAGITWPPAKLALIGIKEDRRLEAWVAGPDGQWKLLKSYPILGMSGELGPKLRQGDRQVPEGLYKVESLNPNSLYHLALRVNYPNAEDQRQGLVDGRTALGSDIMIHGNTCSIGCLAMGDPAAEELFVLAAQTADPEIPIILTPIDFRKPARPATQPTQPPWLMERYGEIKKAIANYGGTKAQGTRH